MVGFNPFDFTGQTWIKDKKSLFLIKLSFLLKIDEK